MPMMVKDSQNRPECIPWHLVSEKLFEGFRMAAPKDKRVIEADHSDFAIRGIEGIQRGSIGRRVVTVMGAGRSRNWLVNCSYSIAVNPRPNHLGVQYPNAVLWLDPVYLNSREKPKYFDRVQQFYPSTLSETGLPNRFEFDMPLPSMKNAKHNRLEIATREGIRQAHFSSIAAVLVGQYLNDGAPVVITGVELEGEDENGESYRDRQFKSWEAASKVLKNVFVHYACQGPLRDLFPVWVNEWRSSNTLVKDEWVIVGGGRSAREHLQRLSRSTMSKAAFITCNSGLGLVGNPHCYYVTDPNALREFKEDYENAFKNDVEIISRKRLEGIETTLCKYDPTDVTYHGRSSGVMMIREAMNRGAKRIHMLGFDGFAPHEMEYEKFGRPYNRHGMNEAMNDALKRIKAENPNVRFMWHGESRLNQDGWTVIH